MNLSKTLILPTDDPDLARSLYLHQIHEEPRVLLTVFGVDASVQSLVEDADRVATSQQGLWWVIWARRREDVAPVVNGLKCPAELKQLLQGCRAIATSRSDVIKDVIGSAEPQPDFTRLWQAFARAEAL
jgi:hypothetical protein